MRVRFDSSLSKFRRRMRTADRRIEKAMKKETREAVKILRREVKKRVRAQYPGGTGFTARKVSGSVKLRRRRGFKTVYGWVGWRFKSTRHNRPTNTPGVWHVPMAYTPYLEQGGLMKRKQSRYVGGQVGKGRNAVSTRLGARRKRAHTALYQGRPFLAPSVRAMNPKILRRLGKTFNAV